MKRTLLLLLLLSLTSPLWGQDELIWDGQILRILREQPTSRLDTAFRHRIPDYLLQGLGGEYGMEWGWYDQEEFQSRWSVENGRLCLDRISYYKFDANEKPGHHNHRLWRDSTFLKELFRDYWQDGQIVASWYSGTFKVIPEGIKPIELVDKFYLTWEKEWIFEFRDGELRSARLEDHQVHQGTVSIYDWYQDSTLLAIWNAFPYERFPALAGCKFHVLIEDGVLDDTGRMIDFTPVLRSRRPAILDEDPGLEAALFEEIKKRLLQFDWTIYRIGDEFTPGRLYGAVRTIELTFPPKTHQDKPE